VLACVQDLLAGVGEVDELERHDVLVLAEPVHVRRVVEVPAPDADVIEPPLGITLERVPLEKSNYRKGKNTGEAEIVVRELLEIARQFPRYSIGIVAGVPQPVAVSIKLHNVPEKGVFNWDPGAQFGRYRPDTFWLDNAS